MKEILLGISLGALLAATATLTAQGAFAASRPLSLLGGEEECSASSTVSYGTAYTDGNGKVHQLRMRCYVETGGDCVNDEDCNFKCGLKIEVDGAGAVCPLDVNGGIDHVTLASDPSAFPECALWHLPDPGSTAGTCPKWTSSGAGGQAPPDGDSEWRDYTKVLPCTGSRANPSFTVTSCVRPEANLTVDLVLSCSSCASR